MSRHPFRTRTLLIGVAAALGLAGLTACSPGGPSGATSASSSGSGGTSSASGTASSSASSASSSAASSSSAGSSLVIWTDAPRAPVLRTFAKSFAADNGITVTVQSISTDLQSAYVTATNAGKGPDIVVGATDWMGNLVQNGSIAPLPLSAAQKQAFEPAALKAVTYNGQTYAVPYATENLALFTNTALARRAPSTFQAMAAAGQAAVAAKKATVPLAMQIGQQGDPYTMQPLFGSTGANIFGTRADGQYDPSKLGVDSAAAQRFGTLLAGYGEKGRNVFRRSIDANNAVNLFATGKAPYLISGPWALSQLKAAKVTYAIDPVPGLAGQGPARPFLGVQAFYVSAKAHNAALAQEFTLNYLTRSDVELALYKADPRPPALTAAYQQVAKTDPDIAAFQRAAAHGVVLPQIPAMSAVWGPLGIAEAAIVGGANPTAALKAANAQIAKAI